MKNKTTINNIAQPGETKRVTEFQRFRRVFFGRAVVIFGFVIILILFFAAIFAPLLAPYDPYEIDMANALQKPGVAHWLGTDEI